MGTTFARGIRAEIASRSAHYRSDWTDGVYGKGTPTKLLSTVAFLFCICLLPTIAFGVLNESNTNGILTVEKAIISQGFGGILFAIFSGQPLVIVLSTAPLSLFIKVINDLAEENNVAFLSLYAWVGLFNMVFLLIYSWSNLSDLFLKHTSPFLEETFAVFISIAFALDAFVALADEFDKNYDSNRRDSALLWIILMSGTVLIGWGLWGFRKSVLLSAAVRTVIVDFALPAAVLIMSIVGTLAFRSVKLDGFNAASGFEFSFPTLNIDVGVIFLALPLGFALSLLFFMDQNVSAALAQSPVNKLKKGVYYHLDLSVIALINFALSLLGLPWMHGALPHSPMHARALSDFDLNIDPKTGHVYSEVIIARETRLGVLIAHILIAASLLLLPVPLKYIPKPVLYGLFLYMAIAALNGNGFWGRIQLLFMEKANYPSATVTRLVNSKVIHKFTFVQLFCLALLCANGFFPNPYVQMTFPVLLVLLILVRLRILNSWFPADLKYLDPSHFPVIDQAESTDNSSLIDHHSF